MGASREPSAMMRAVRNFAGCARDDGLAPLLLRWRRFFGRRVHHQRDDDEHEDRDRQRAHQARKDDPRDDDGQREEGERIAEQSRSDAAGRGRVNDPVNLRDRERLAGPQRNSLGGEALDHATERGALAAHLADKGDDGLLVLIGLQHGEASRADLAITILRKSAGMSAARLLPGASFLHALGNSGTLKFSDARQYREKQLRGAVAADGFAARVDEDQIDASRLPPLHRGERVRRGSENAIELAGDDTDAGLQAGAKARAGRSIGERSRAADRRIGEYLDGGGLDAVKIIAAPRMAFSWAARDVRPSLACSVVLTRQ